MENIKTILLAMAGFYLIGVIMGPIGWFLVAVATVLVLPFGVVVLLAGEVYKKLPVKGATGDK